MIPRSHRLPALVLGLASALLYVTTAPVSAGSVSRDVPFELDRWIELDSTDGPVTLHRLRIERVSGGLTKSKLFRPGNDDYLETVQIQIEYSNSSTRDWEVEIDLRWVDAKGRTIDGYHDDEDLDDEERHDQATVTLSTLTYGLDQAKRLVFDLRYDPD